MNSIQRWDIFCKVVDNFGDAGIAWRLARQLVSEYGFEVRLYVDALPALARIAHDVDAAIDEQCVRGVSIVRWSDDAGATHVVPDGHPHREADVVIEAFGCGFSESYLRAMAERIRPPLWINLEYLSAEPWIDGCHCLVSRHPRLPLERHFFFPGFSANSGGLLREGDLFARRDAFLDDRAATAELWGRLQMEPPARDALTISMFFYPNRGTADLFDALSGGDRDIVCIVPEGVATAELDQWSRSSLTDRSTDPRIRGRLRVQRVPFTTQEDYDRLLWVCEMNFVRGEDSFVRAQWAARPLAWQAYPQPDDAHHAKVSAFLDRYCRDMPAKDAAAFRTFMEAWNAVDGEPTAAAAAWPALAAALPVLAAHARQWSALRALERDLACALVNFAAGRVQSSVSLKTTY